MILSVGEILIDEFNNNGLVEKKAGGAPFNVAMNIAKFGGLSSFYGVVGSDEDGNFLLETAKKALGTRSLVKNSPFKTSKAIVTLTNGERSFRFDRNEGSDYRFSLDDLKAIDLSKVSIVHFGSLMISFKEGYDFLLKAIAYIKTNSKALVSYDINYRDDIFDDKEVSLQMNKEIFKMVDIIKISDDELRLFTKEKDLNKALKEVVPENVHCFISLGKEGSAYYHRDNLIKADSIFVKPIDTTGAGDAFYSYVLFALDKNNFDNSEKEIKEILKLGNVIGALTTLGKGAIEPVPTLEEAKKHLG